MWDSGGCSEDQNAQRNVDSLDWGLIYVLAKNLETLSKVEFKVWLCFNLTQKKADVVQSFDVVSHIQEINEF